MGDRQKLSTRETAAAFCLWRNSTSAGKSRPKLNHLEVSSPGMELLGGSGYGRTPHDCASAEGEAGHVPGALPGEPA